MLKKEQPIMQDMSRREFLGRTAMAAAAAGLGLGISPAGAEGKQAMESPATLPIIDTHQHLWHLEKLAPPWLAGAGALNRTCWVDDYRQATAGLNFERSVYLEVDVAPEPAAQEHEADLILALCNEGQPFPCAAVIGGNPAAPDFKDYLDRYQGQAHLRGVRNIPKPQAGRPHPLDEPAFAAGLRLLGERGLHFELNVYPADLERSARLTAQCPGTQFVLDHCGFADPKHFKPGAGAEAAAEADRWRRGLDLLAARPNVCCKISGIVALADPAGWSAADLAPIVNHCLDAFGPDSVVFGSDWPVCTRVASARQWTQALREIIAERPLETQRKLLRENALRVYRLT